MMAKERVIKQMSDQQRERIMNSPGVIVRRRETRPETPFFRPRFVARQKVAITASELIDADDDDERVE